MILPNGIEIISLQKQQGKVTLQNNFGVGNISFDKELPKRIAEQVRFVSQWTENHKNENFNYQNVNDILPKPEDAVYVNFRALSKVVVPGYWLDWTRDGVLEAGVELLKGATVYPNHNFFDINNAIGSVSESSWDADGKNSNGIPGINATYSIDALMNPKIARGLLWQPPYIHSTSLTVLFEFEFSHPTLVEERRFWNLLGEEVDGEIVRLIITKIREIWEASLVFQGADRLAKGLPDADDDFEEMTADTQPQTKKEKTMKLTPEQIKSLGLEVVGDDVPESEILKVALSLATANKAFDGINLTELQAKAATAENYVAEQRKEVRRLACVAEVGSAEGTLDDFVSTQIDEADYDRLVKMREYYEKKAAEKFPKFRTSQENSADVETAGGISQRAITVQPIGLHS